nr:hypothetical protein [Scytonema sp. UIC 10036]
MLYPSLFQQPLIDHWLLQTYPDFKDWIEKPCDRRRDETSQRSRWLFCGECYSLASWLEFSNWYRSRN